MSYSDSSFARLYGLLGFIADTSDDDLRLRAELKAYAYELGILRSRLQSNLEQMFSASFSVETLNAYCRLLGLSLALTESEKRRQVSDLLTQGFTLTDSDEVLDAMYDMDEEMAYIKSSFALDFSFLDESLDSIIPAFCGIVDRYFPPSTTVTLGGDGKSWEWWDGADKSFGELDSVGLTYNMFDTV